MASTLAWTFAISLLSSSTARPRSSFVATTGKFVVEGPRHGLRLLGLDACRLETIPIPQRVDHGGFQSVYAR